MDHPKWTTSYKKWPKATLPLPSWKHETVKNQISKLYTHKITVFNKLKIIQQRVHVLTKSQNSKIGCTLHKMYTGEDQFSCVRLLLTKNFQNIYTDRQ